MVSSEMPELLGASDRIVVMLEGRVVSQLANENITLACCYRWKFDSANRPSVARGSCSGKQARCGLCVLGAGLAYSQYRWHGSPQYLYRVEPVGVWAALVELYAISDCSDDLN